MTTKVKRNTKQGPLQARNKQLTAEVAAWTRLNEATKRLWETTDLKAGLKEILEASITLLSADFGNVQLLDPEKKVLRIFTHRGFKKEFLDFFYEVSTEDN